MTYYTLSGQGRRWFAGKEKAPEGDLKVLNALAGLIRENDVPRTIDQICRTTNLTSRAVENALTTLIKTGYVAQAKPPQPMEKTVTPKLRIRSPEDIVAAEMRAEESRKRYDHSEKGFLAHKMYEWGEKARTKNQRYWSKRGLLVQKAWRLRRNIRTMTEHGIAKELIAKEEAKLKAVEKELKD